MGTCKKLGVALAALTLLTVPVLAQEQALPGVGEMMSGFVVTEVAPMDVLGATAVTFEHTKSGATLLYLASADTNRAFDITFRTPALDEKGKPHIFEHLTICGSQKYPDANMFFPFSNQTYSTFVNAMTYHGMTSYPVASLSEEQLMTMMDYYLSGVFTPLLYQEPKLVEREAWRYEMTREDAPLNIAGTVYSEMQGVLTIERQAQLNIMNTLFENGAVSHESGGRPEAIRTLTYDELIAFHDSYYHPSNALITLYGDMDYAKFLEYIDREYLSGYDKKDIYVEAGRVTPYQETLYREYTAPVEASATTEKATHIYYSFAANDISLKDTLGLMVLANVFNQESSPLMRAVRERLPGATVMAMLDMDAPAPMFHFYAMGVDASDRDTLVSIVDEAIAAYGKNGIPQEELDSILSIAKLSLLLTPEEQHLGVMASLNISQGWTYFNTLDFYNVYEDMLDTADTAYIASLIQTWLTDNAHRAVAVTSPEPGKAEENAAALADELDRKKASMTKEEIETLVAQSNALIEWAATGVDADVIAPLLNVTVETLPEERVTYEVAETKMDGVTYMHAHADVGAVGQTLILLDGSTIPIAQLRDVQVYLSLLGNLDTEKYTKEALSVVLTRYLSGFSASLSAQTGNFGASDLYSASISWIGLSSDYPASVDLLGEIFYRTQLTDTQTIRSLLVRKQTQLRNALDSNPLTIQLLRCHAALSDTAAYNAYIADMDMYRYLKELIALADNDPAALTARLESAKEWVENRHNAIALFAGNDESIALFEETLPAFFADMPDIAREAVDYSTLRIPMTREALVNNSTVFMNLIVATNDSYSGMWYPLNSLIDDMYMLPKLRNAMGAYGAYCNVGMNFAVLYTYRDPNLKNSYDIFEALPEYLRTVELTQSDVDKYIVGSYAALARPKGALTGALTALSDRLYGLDDALYLQRMREAKSTTVADVRAAADVIEQLVHTGVRSTSGSQSQIDANGDLFDTVVRIDDDVA